MELAILAGLSLIGYEISRKSSNNKKPKQKLNETSQIPIKTGSTQEIKQDTNMPFFRSEKSQNTNDGFKDVRLATFTGIDNLEYNHRKETTPQFKPVENLKNINPFLNRLAAYVCSNHNLNKRFLVTV